MSTPTLQRAETPAVAGTVWRIDPTRSSIGFSIRHMTFATVHGHFGSFEGTIRFDPEHPNDAVVEAQIDAATIDTGIAKRDDHLRSADFFDVTTYPVIAFRSTRVTPINPLFGHPRMRVLGDLTLRGVTRPVELAVEQTGEPAGWDAEVIGFTATARIHRKDFGMVFNLPVANGGLVVGDEVRITIAVQARNVTS